MATIVSSRRGISLLDLFNLPAGSQALLPDQIAAQLELFAVLDLRSSASPDAVVYHGSLQSIGEGLALPGLRDWVIEVPGANVGIPFQLIFLRTEQAGTAAGELLEPAPETFQLDLFMDRFAVTIPGLQPAIVQETPGGPTHLVRDRTREKVKLVGGAIFRLLSTPEGTSAQFVDAPDPLDPHVPTGFIAGLTCDPPSFFFGSSEFGMTVDRLLYDGSKSFTPPSIVERGQGADWMGLSMREATVYFPPSLGHLSVGVRDLLLGHPFGLQLEVRVEFGYLNLDDIALSFRAEGSETPLPLEGTGQARTLRIDGDAVRIVGTASAGFLPSSDTRTSSGLWTLPRREGNRTEVVGLGSGSFEAQPGDVVRFQARAIAASDEDEIAAQFPEVLVRVERAASAEGGGEAASPRSRYAPQIALTVNGHRFTNVVQVIGSAAQLATVQLEAIAPEDGSTLRWQTRDSRLLGTGQTLTGTSLPTTAGEHYITLQGPETSQMRRLLLEVEADAGELLIGTENGVFNGHNTRVAVAGVRSLLDLDAFHTASLRQPVNGPRPTPVDGTVAVAEGQLAVSLVEAGATAPPVLPPSLPVSLPSIMRRFPMVFAESSFLGGLGPLEDLLQPYAANPAVQVIVIGRTDDLWRASSNQEERRRRNAALAQERAEAGRREVIRILGGDAAASRVFARGEQVMFATALSADTSDRLPAQATDPSWLIVDGGYLNQPPPNLLPETLPRPDFRAVEVWVVLPAGTPPPSNGAGDPSTTDPGYREVLIPGGDRTTPPPAPRPRDQTQADPRGWRFRLIAKWDSPTLMRLADAIPTLAEVLIEWEGDRLELPSGAAAPTTVPLSRREVFAITGRWAHDPRSGETLFSLRVESRNDPNGLFPTIDVPVLAATFGFAPALLAAIDVDDPGANLAAVGGLFVAAGFLTETLPPLDKPLIPEGKLAIRAIQAEQRFFAGEAIEESRTRVTVDYSVELGFAINTSILGLNTSSDKPIRIKYKNVGFEIKWRREGGVTSFDGVYDQVSFEIEDPGQWTITGPMGNLLRVTGSRAGTGSSWFEFDLAFSIDLGVVSITNAIVRLIFPPGGGAPSVELRGLGVAVDIPGVLKGAGRLAFGAGGDVRGAIEANIIPAKLEVAGAIAIKTVQDENFTFVFVQIGVLFAVGIPLAQSGTAIYGLIGRFVANGARALPAEEDPIEREIKWHALPPESKYDPRRGQWAIGLGAVIGTMPDTGFSFNALGMFTVSFPEISVVFGIDAKFMSLPEVAAEDREETGGTDLSLKLLGLVAIDSQSVKIGIRGTFEIPEVLKLLVPISAYFPITKNSANPFDAYLRIGADGVRPPSADLGHPRLGDTVTLQFLPSTLNVQVWAYLMFEEKRLYALGNDPRFDLTGFCIGFGAGFSLGWGGGPIRLVASAKILIGVGTKPLTMVGGIFVRGELWLVIIGLSISGELVLKLSEREQSVTGEFCGEVSFFFFSVKGCVKFALGTAPDLDIPFPGLLVPKLDLTDRRGVVTGTLNAPATLPPSTAVPADIPVVWPDTVPVISFLHHLRSHLEADSPTRTNITRSHQPPTAPLWTGTSELKYTFRLTGVELWQQIDGSFQRIADTLPAGWWWPTHRPGVLAPIDGTDAGPASPSEHEGRQLALLTWQPGVWAESLSDGGAGIPGDPATTVTRLCDPAPPLTPVCVLGRLAQRLSHDQVRLRPDGPSQGPYFDRFEVIGTESAGALDLGAVSLLLDDLGLYLVRGRAIDLSHPITNGGGYELTAAYRFMRFFSTLAFRGRFSTTVDQPTLLLALAKSRLEGGQGTPGGPSQPVRRCITFGNAQPVNSPAMVLRHEGLVFTTRTGSLTFGQSYLNSSPAVRIPVEEVRIQLPQESRWVSLRINIKGDAGLKVEVLNGAGVMVASDGGTYSLNHTFTFAGDRLRELILRGSAGQPVSVIEICTEVLSDGKEGDRFDDLPNYYPAALLEGRYDDLFSLKPSDSLPPVIGVLPNGRDMAWPGAITAEDDAWIYVLYTAPDSREGWQGFRIDAWSGHRLALVRVCANTTQAQRQQQSEERTRAIQRDTINTLATDGSGTGSAPEPGLNRYLLERDRLYQLRVHWQWAGWRKTDAEPEPPDPQAAAFNSRWQPETSQYFYFRTAAEIPASTTPLPTELIDERQFDPRGALRYFLGFEVAAQPDRHLLNDPIQAHFRVKHLAQLMENYGYDLRLEVRRTDMPPGSRIPERERLPLEASFSLDWGPLAFGLMSRLEQRLVKTAEAAPCLAGYPTEGTTATITADLLPRAEYDLILLAKQTDGELVIARTHFYTSRYGDVPDLLRGQGYPTSGSPSFDAPQDVVVTAALPASSSPLGDRPDDSALDATLRQIGLDPFPLSDQPRTTLLWQNAAGTWRLVGVLIDSDEPLQRWQPRLLNDVREPQPRLAVVDMQVRAGATVLTTLTPIYSNQTATRVLLRPTAPLSASDLNAASDLRLALRLRDNSTLRSGFRALSGAPIYMAEVD